MTKDTRDKAMLREYALICRVLMMFLCVGYLATVIVLGIALSAKSEDHVGDPVDKKFQAESKAHFYRKSIKFISTPSHPSSL